MHFSIPDTQEFSKDGTSYTGYNIHVNGIFHCTVRYKQLHCLYDQIKKEFASIAVQLPLFPGKKILPLSGTQLEERRLYLEKYIQAVGQDPVLSTCELFNSFLLAAQQETNGPVENRTLDVFLMNGYKISLDVKSNERSDEILEKVCGKLNLPEEYTYYFSLFLIKKDSDGDITIVRKLQDFESPSLTQQSMREPHTIVLRKNYWDSEYDLELMTHKVSLNLLYVQTVSDVEQGWILCSKETMSTLANLQSMGAKKKYLELARTLKYYGFIQFRPCKCDYPYPGSNVLVAAGNKELNLRVRLTDGDEMRQGSFKVTRMRCWRITTLHSDEPGDAESANLELSFEYLMAKDKLQWITISSEQAILMSICLHSMVDELLLKKSGLRRKTCVPGKNNKWNYIKRDGSSEILSLSHSSTRSELSSHQNGKESPGTNQGTSENQAESHGNASHSTMKSMKKLTDKFQTRSHDRNMENIVRLSGRTFHTGAGMDDGTEEEVPSKVPGSGEDLGQEGICIEFFRPVYDRWKERKGYPTFPSLSASVPSQTYVPIADSGMCFRTTVESHSDGSDLKLLALSMVLVAPAHPA